MSQLRRFLQRLRDLPEEKPLEPELKSERQQHDKKIREEQDLANGAVLEAVMEPGEGDAHPQDGDLVYVHYAIRSTEDDERLLYSTRPEDGGSGQPLAFRIGQGRRAPRGWELSLMGMSKGQRKALRIQPGYGYQHPDCGFEPPKGVPAKQPLNFDLQLVCWHSSKDVRHYSEGEQHHPDFYRRTLKEADSWETARALNEVTVSITARTVAPDGTPQQGPSYYTEAPLQLQLGQGLLPEGVEVALGHMARGEHVLWLVPAALMAPPAVTAAVSAGEDSAAAGSAGANGGQNGKQKCLMPRPPDWALQVEVEIQLLALVQVRDMTGDGAVTKHRLRDGSGDFPVDCALHDTAMRLHYRVRPLSSAPNGTWIYNSRANSTGSLSSSNGSRSTNTGSKGSAMSEGPGSGSAQAGGADSSSGAAQQHVQQEGGPIEVDTGCGELPEGIEMSAKLMVPGEVALVRCQPKYAYQGRSDAPAGIHPNEPVEFEVELVSFDKEGYWQTMDMPERLALSERMKAKGNALFKQKKYAYAAARYQRLLQLLSSTKDFETQEEVDAVDALKAACLSNLALCAHNQGDYAGAVSWADKALDMDPSNAKMMFRKGKALSAKGDHDEADEALTKAAELDPAVAKEVEAARAANAQLRRAAAQKQKQQFRNFFDRT